MVKISKKLLNMSPASSINRLPTNYLGTYTNTIRLPQPIIRHAVATHSRVPRQKLFQRKPRLARHIGAGQTVSHNSPLIAVVWLSRHGRRGRRRLTRRGFSRRRRRGRSVSNTNTVRLAQPVVGRAVGANSRVPRLELHEGNTGLCGHVRAGEAVRDEGPLVAVGGRAGHGWAGRCWLVSGSIANSYFVCLPSSLSIGVH